MRLNPSAIRTLAGAAFLLGAAVAAAQSDTPADAAVRDTRAALEQRADTQRARDEWAAERTDLERRYHAARADVRWLERRRDERGARLASLESRLSELRRRLDEADRLEGSMQDTLQVIFGRLEEHVATSLPFLPEERQDRLDDLRAELARPDVAAAEKLRRLLEALQVEAGYAGTVEVYRDAVELDGEPVHVDILRLGNVALFWRTPDQDRAGVYDQAEARWVEVSSAAARRVTLAMEMAARTRPMEVVPLPLGRIGGEGGAP